MRIDIWTEELHERKQSIEKIVRWIRHSSVVIYTLGVCPAFFERSSGQFTPHSSSSFATRSFAIEHIFRMTTVEENVSNLNAILDLLRRISPNVRLVVTVSPVPLHATFERTSAIVSDCVSKSTLRVAAEEFCKQHDDGVFYWPAFEMIKWVSPHREPFFGIDDGAPSHISDDAVGVVVDSFLERCVVPAAKS